MVSHPEDATFRGSELPGFAQRLPAAVQELRLSTDELIETFWDEMFRSHVCAQAAALAQAAKLQGFVRVFTLARAMASICFIRREEALPIRQEVTEKLYEILGLLEEAIDDSLEQQTG